VLNRGLAALDPLDEIDLVCAPDIMLPRSGESLVEEDVQQMQRAVLSHCEQRGDRLAILDAFPDAKTEKVLAQRRGLSGQGLSGANGALYYPWIWVPQPTVPPGKETVPPCGHIAGVYARSDRRVGVHKAPANEL